jgi:hypothetical protein
MMRNTLFGPVFDKKEEEAPKQKSDVWTVINSLNMKDYQSEEEILKNYNPWIVNRSMGSFKELLYHVQEMNINHFLEPKMQYDYYFYSIPKQKRFKKWLKKEQDSDDKYIRVLADLYNYSLKKAAIAWKLLNEEQRKIIINNTTPSQKSIKNK